MGSVLYSTYSMDLFARYDQVVLDLLLDDATTAGANVC